MERIFERFLFWAVLVFALLILADGIYDGSYLATQANGATL